MLHVRHFTDLHLHPHRYGATLDGYGRNTRLAAGGRALQSALQDPIDRTDGNSVAPDLILFGGDLFEQHGLLPTCAVVELLNHVEAVPEDQIRVALNGNHDGSEQGHGVSAIALLSVLGFQGEFDPGHAGVEGARLVTIPYRSRQEDLDEDLQEAYQAVQDADPCPLIILGHNGLVGPDEKGIPGEAVYRVAELLEIFQRAPELGLLFLGGHWHWPQAWVGDPPQKSQGMVPGVWGNAGRFACVQTGSTVPLTWADRGSPRGYLNAIWSDDRGWGLQFVELEAPRFIDLDETPDAPVRSCDFVRGSRSKISKIEDAAAVEVVEQEEADQAKDRADLRLDDAVETTVGKYVAHQQVEPEPASRLSRLGLELLQAAAKPVRG